MSQSNPERPSVSRRNSGTKRSDIDACGLEATTERDSMNVASAETECPSFRNRTINSGHRSFRLAR